jgi:hypothetical protein
MAEMAPGSGSIKHAVFEHMALRFTCNLNVIDEHFSLSAFTFHILG